MHLGGPLVDGHPYQTAHKQATRTHQMRIEMKENQPEYSSCMVCCYTCWQDINPSKRHSYFCVCCGIIIREIKLGATLMHRSRTIQISSEFCSQMQIDKHYSCIQRNYIQSFEMKIQLHILSKEPDDIATGIKQLYNLGVPIKFIF